MDSTYCEKGAYCQDHTANQENLMDTNNWRSTPPSGEPTMDTGDWRTQLQPDSRQRIVNKIMDTLKRHLPFSGLEGLNELRKIAVRFEEKIFTAARSQPDYLRRISLKMLTMETKSQNTIPYTGNNSNSPDLGSQVLQNQVHSQGQSIPIPLQSNQSQARQQLLPQNVPNNMATAGVQSSAGLQSGMPSVSGLTQNPMPNVVGQNSNLQSMSGISQNLLGQGMPSNIFANQQRQMQERQQMLSQQKQQQHLYHQQLQHQLMKQNIQQGNIQPSLMQPHMQQQNLLPPAQLQSSQQSASLDSTAQTGHANGGDWQEEVYQKIKTMKETYLPELNEVYQKIAAKLQQHDSLPQQPKSEQLEKLKIFKTMLERIITFLSVSKANILPSFKDTLSSYEKQIMNFINANRPRKSVSALQQGQLPPPRMHSMQQPQPQINQIQSYDSQMNPQLQSINLQGSVPTMQSNNVTSLQHNSLASLPGVSTAQQTMLNSLQPGSNLDSGQASLDSTAPTGHANAGDWQEEAYQKIKTMKETYLPELNEMYQKIAAKLQQHDSLPQQPKSEQLEKLKIFKTMLERIITFLSVSKANILPSFKDKLSSYEKQIMNFINANRPRKSVSALQQGQLPLPHMHSMQQPQLQINQTESYDSQMNPQLQSINLQGSVPTMQSNNMTSLQHSSSSLPGVSTAQQNMLNSLQPGSNLDSDEQSKPGAQFLTSSPPLFRAPFVPSTSTLLTPSPKPGCSEKPIYGPSSLSNYRNISHQQATGEQARSECPVPDTPGNGMSTPLLLAGFENGNDTHGNALITDFGKSNVEEQRHDPRFIMAKPMSLKSLSASVVTMVDEAGAAVGEDLAGMRKRGLHARNFFTLAGMTGADKMRCYMSAIVILVLLFWCIFVLHHQN